MNTNLISLRQDIPSISGAEALIKSLLYEGVDTIFGYPGGGIMPAYDAIYHYKNQLRHILVRHEQGAIHAAQGYARTSGKVGVAIVTSGPGATNIITGIADAYADSTPLVCITGQVGTKLLGSDAFQEVDILNISLAVTKWSVQIPDVASISKVISKAFFIAKSGRPGPVIVDIPKDIQFALSPFEHFEFKNPTGIKQKPSLNGNQLLKASDLLNTCKHPMILVGQGVTLSNAEKELLQFAEKSGFPVASTLLGLSAFPTNHPLYVGMLGMHGNYAPNILTNECDLILAIGMRFDDRVTGDASRYGKSAKIIHIDVDESEFGKVVHCDAPIHADAKEALLALTSIVKEQQFDSWLDQFRNYKNIENDKVEMPQLFPNEGITMGKVIRILSEETKGDAIIVTDVGQHQMIASRYFKFLNNRSLVTSGGLGTMGFCLPASMGANLGAPNRTTIAVVGDGGIQMTIQELGTIVSESIPVKIILLNNGYLGMVRQWQEMFFEKRYSFVEMSNPNFGLIAQGYGLPYSMVTEPSSLVTEIQRMLEHNGPYLLEVSVLQEDNVFPMVPAGCAVNEIRLE
ncbi:MAG: biosynthetic-type acetolactate synthase large subunit [Bacteroidales bacterium]|nr:MAG: biosynthetic-type acetolactate synthase large subunit [Bacteroidales bacterium]